VWELLLLILLDGREAYVAPRQIVSIAEAKDADDPGKHYTDKVKCVVSMTDGKIYAVAEECDEIEKRLHEIGERRIKEFRK
jgi:uncharacterized protein YlzI (FlbEa/FlbD family)